MENHPIPQDVTGFKFKIIGSITIKQFGYILLSGVFCLIFFLIPMPILVKFPLMFLSGAAGLALAFIPIEGRPMDTMAMHFFHALTTNTQYLYHKKGVNLTEMELFKPLKVEHAKSSTAQSSPHDDTKRKELASALRNSYFRPDAEEMAYIKNMKSAFDTSSVPASTTPKVAINPAAQPVRPAATEVAQPVVKNPIQADRAASAQPVQLPKEQTTIQPVSAVRQPPQPEPIPQPPVQAQASETPNIEPDPTPAVPVPPSAPIQADKLENATSAKTVRDRSLQYSAGFPILPDKPNVIIGVVKDPRGKVMQHVLVEVLDQNDIPVRAFKTNALGQFASATPLPNGTYKILFDDPQKKNEFETIEVTLDGQEIFQPLEVFSVDQREKLRRELFGGAPASNQTAPAASV